MSVETVLWKVGIVPERLAASALKNERLLEEMIVSTPSLLSEEWMLIGRQEGTGYGGRIDLLAIAPDASLILIELKRDQTPREVVTQALDYAGWVNDLKATDLLAIYSRYRPSQDLLADFRAHHGKELVLDEINQTHQIVIVAASLDSSTERIVNYLSSREVPITSCSSRFSQQVKSRYLAGHGLSIRLKLKRIQLHRRINLQSLGMVNTTALSGMMKTAAHGKTR